VGTHRGNQPTHGRHLPRPQIALGVAALSSVLLRERTRRRQYVAVSARVADVAAPAAPIT
ncbi:TPA: hypothetical protein ACKP4S_001769, partial [Stenotrophomonas maltophilia]